MMGDECFPQECRKRKNNFDLPFIVVKQRDSDCPNIGAQVVLLNGKWDTSTPIPSIIAEMHNVSAEELRALQKRHCVVGQQPPPPPHHDEIDCVEGNLSWLLNYKIQELPPVPDSTSVDPVTIGKDDPLWFPLRAKDEFKVEGYGKQIVDCCTGNCTCVGLRKPPFTYTELIEYALSEKGELTVSGIYQWISDHFPFYKQNDDRWKNSVRHNLSINPHFRKGGKAVHGAGHLWTIAQQEDKKSWNLKKQRIAQFMQMNCNKAWNEDKQLEMELATATASILPESNEDNTRNGFGKTANGLKPQNIEVEFINIVDVTNGLEDFLCPPVTKEQVVEECGLGDDYLITDLNPQTLGLNLAEAEIITNGSIYDDLSFQCYEMQSE